jgi:hypothetical protein
VQEFIDSTRCECVCLCVCVLVLVFALCLCTRACVVWKSNECLQSFRVFHKSAFFSKQLLLTAAVKQQSSLLTAAVKQQSSSVLHDRMHVSTDTLCIMPTC